LAQCPRGQSPGPAAQLRAGKPRKDESLFVLTRLHSSDELGRPCERIPPSWFLTSRQEVSGHIKLPPYGPQLSMRRLIWVDGYVRDPADIPLKPRAYAIQQSPIRDVGSSLRWDPLVSLKAWSFLVPLKDVAR